MEHFESRAATHDLGGQSRFICKPIDRQAQIPIDDFGRRVDALRIVLGGAKIVTVDELRRAVEGLSVGEYEGMGYYERWLHALCAIMIEKGVLTEEDLG
ncbi:SH3-like domain-containing protein [Pseudomonas syringae]|uniref:HTH TFE/IIEalpha-type domain-containing protein n=1 Tax=Pseudomonas syringae pv. aceris TaxID=199198 RepID=A0A0L8IQ21_PSESX|nr:SH3-like domain-containing protein [Pseudomonas syringae]EGH71511.1 hypothetical protein PSYAR_13229 [Pseudomonas syringae pv. aceris str. M302273]KOG03518.1 Uncharacterized protein ABJ98_2356 [Pseudomonas syringae pv. aceris]KPW09188.1 Uncharacterized protein ALO91_03384 [Pseudomonas syringae pv. aceris]